MSHRLQQEPHAEIGFKIVYLAAIQFYVSWVSAQSLWLHIYCSTRKAGSTYTLAHPIIQSQVIVTLNWQLHTSAIKNTPAFHSCQLAYSSLKYAHSNTHKLMCTRVNIHLLYQMTLDHRLTIFSTRNRCFKVHLGYPRALLLAP